MQLRDRSDGGRRLAAVLAGAELDDPLVLALPRGGVPVALEVAVALGAPLDVIVARKVGAPGHQEYGIGAIAAGGSVVVDRAAVAELGVRSEERRVGKGWVRTGQSRWSTCPIQKKKRITI